MISLETLESRDSPSDVVTYHILVPVVTYYHLPGFRLTDVAPPDYSILTPVPSVIYLMKGSSGI